MFLDGLLDFFSLYGGTVVDDAYAEVTYQYFHNVLLKANFATDKIGAVFFATRRVTQCFEGVTRNEALKTVCFNAMLAQKASVD